MDDLFTPLQTAERQALLDAGWVSTDYGGVVQWRSPDSKMLVSETVALEMLRQQGKGGG
jgi:hypothetical protein